VEVDCKTEDAVAATIAASTERVAMTALRIGLGLVVVGSSTDALFVALGGGPAPVVLEGAALATLGLLGCIWIGLAGRLLRPRGRTVLVMAAFVAGGALDHHVWSDYGEVAIAIVALIAVVAPPLWVAGCEVLAVLGYMLGLLTSGRSAEWMLFGPGFGQVANEAVGLALTGAVMLLAIGALRLTLRGATASLAGTRRGGSSLTPQLAAAVRVTPAALLGRADPRAVTTPLSEAERRVLDCLAAGLAPKQAARKLGVALPTVRSQIATAKRKTGARTIEQLVGLFAEARVDA
jgi:DNA-binding CsgD family transcriptional regulator